MREIATIIIRHSDGKFLVHLRASTKSLYPNKYGLGAGGKLEIGESALEAARRELFEETGLKSEPGFLFSFDFVQGVVIHRVHVFEIASDNILNWNKEEWQLITWLDSEEVSALAERELLCPDTKFRLLPGICG